ncbi:MAG: site-2 protease family protein [Thermoplasmatales archaeon]|nr:MAG: site-2 protease family protein [Thermoplasmatales archaeon]
MSENWNSFETKDKTRNLDIDLLKDEVGKHFPFYDIKFNADTAVFFCTIDEETLEKNFDSLRISLSEKGYLPMLRYEKGEHILYVFRKPKRKEKSIWINIALLIATIITTILTGSILHIGETDIWSLSNITDIFAFKNIIIGAALFAFPLMSILFVHEMGHYYISKKHGISTSLPYFMPIPPIIPGFNIGTFGALIASRDAMPDKKALFDVGMAGPLTGFMVAVPVTIIGILSADIVPIIPISDLPTGETAIGFSLLIEILINSIKEIPNGFTISINPIFFAGWVGLLITSINLLPAGQLDGGHIFRAIFGEKQKYIGWVAVLILIFTGWLFFAFIIIFMMGASHPPPLNDKTEIGMKRKILFVVALIMLILCFIPFPIVTS